MDHLPHSKASYGQATTEGSNWAEGQQKNAYARLVQQHHSGRFKYYLNYIAQKFQQEESAHGDSLCDKDSSFVGAIKDEGKNGIGAIGSRPENVSDLGSTNKNRETAVQKHHHCSDATEDGDLDVGEKPKTHDCKKEPRHEKAVFKSQHGAKSISREQESEVGQAPRQMTMK